MTNYKKFQLLVFLILLNIFFVTLVLYFYFSHMIILEILLAVFAVQGLVIGFIGIVLWFHSKIKGLARNLKFNMVSRFLEQPRIEGMYKQNWWQIHFSSRTYSEYWGKPRTYVKLQFKEKKKFMMKTLNKERGKCIKGVQVESIDYVKRSYKNYLLMRCSGFVYDEKKIKSLMNFLLNVAQESEDFK